MRYLTTLLVVVFAGMYLPGTAKKWVVTVKNFSFSPYNLTHVKVHDTIQWVWAGGTHSTTSASIPAAAEPWHQGITQDSTTFIYVPTENGTYFYRSLPDSARDMKGQFVVYGANGTDEMPWLEGFSLFPVPFCDHVWIGLPAGTHGPLNLEVFNRAGGLAFSGTIAGGMVAGDFLVETSMLPPGVYSFRLTDGRRYSKVLKGVCRP